MTMFRRIDHIEITPVDFDRSISFYTDVLGFKGRSRITVDAVSYTHLTLPTNREV